MKELYYTFIFWFGQITPIDVGGSDDQLNIPKTNVNATLSGVLDLVYFIAGAVSVIVIIVAGIMFVTSTGNAQQVTKARNLALGGVIGLVVVLSAMTLTFFVSGRF